MLNQHHNKIIVFLMLMLVVSLPVPLCAAPVLGTLGDPVSAELDALYVKGLNYLVESQNTNGSYKDSRGTNPAVTALAMVAMLAHGEDPDHGPYAKSLKQGLGFLLKNQQTNGMIGHTMYNHGFSVLALAEAYGAMHDPRIGPALEKGVKALLSSQESNSSGGWRYSYRGNSGDTTISGACLVGLLAARNAGIAVPQRSVDRALKFYQYCQSGDGGFGYTAANSSNVIRTAIGTLVFALAKERSSEVYKNATTYLGSSGYVIDGSYHRYGLYYLSQALFQSNYTEWQAWHKRNVEALSNSQAGDGSWSGNHGPAFSTGSSLLSLALSYRLLPIYER